MDAAGLINELEWQAYASPFIPSPRPTVPNLPFTPIVIPRLQPTLALINRSFPVQGLPPVTQPSVNVDSFGAVGDGVANDSGAFQTALNSGASFVNATPTKNYFLASTISIPSNTFLIGSTISSGDSPSNGTNNQQPLLTLATTATISVNQSAGIVGFNIARQGILLNVSTTQSNQASTIQNVSNFTGTAITIGSGSGVCVRDCFVLGHSTAIQVTGQQRFHLRDVSFDCTSGIVVDNCHDVAELENCTGQIYLSGPPPNVGSQSAINIVAGSSTGITTVTMVNTGSLSTGMLMYLAGSAGVPGANGKWTCSNVTATTFDIPLTFSGAFSGNGTVWAATAYRSGVAYQVSSSEALRFVNCFDYGRQTAFYFTTGHNNSLLINCGCDEFVNALDPTTTGIKIDKNAQGVCWVGGGAHAKGVPLTLTSSNNALNSQAHKFIGCEFTASGVTVPVTISSATVLLIGCNISSKGSGGQNIILSSPNRIVMSGCDFHNQSIIGNTTNTTINNCIFNFAGSSTNTFNVLKLPTAAPSTGTGIVWASNGVLVVA